jgi:hypothetical protein
VAEARHRCADSQASSCAQWWSPDGDRPRPPGDTQDVGLLALIATTQATPRRLRSLHRTVAPHTLSYIQCNRDSQVEYYMALAAERELFEIPIRAEVASWLGLP